MMSRALSRPIRAESKNTNETLSVDHHCCSLINCIWTSLLYTIQHNMYIYIYIQYVCIYIPTVYLYMWVIFYMEASYLPVYRFQHSFVIGGDSNRSITNMVVSGMGVWLSLQNSAVLRLVHSVTCDILAEVNTAPAVTKMLSSKYRPAYLYIHIIMCVAPFSGRVLSRRHYM